MLPGRRLLDRGQFLAAETVEIHPRVTRAATAAEDLRTENAQIRSQVANAEVRIVYERAGRACTGRGGVTITDQATCARDAAVTGE